MFGPIKVCVISHSGVFYPQWRKIIFQSVNRKFPNTYVWIKAKLIRLDFENRFNVILNI